MTMASVGAMWLGPTDLELVLLGLAWALAVVLTLWPSDKDG